MPLAGMVMEVVQAEEQVAKAKINPPEFMVSTFIKLERSIAETPTTGDSV